MRLVANPQFWCHVWEWVDSRGTKPSTGLAGVVMALRMCTAPVSLFGFSHNASNFHYFNAMPDDLARRDVYTFHPLAEEAQLYAELAQRGLVRLVNGMIA